MPKQSKGRDINIIARNRTARHDYDIVETWEAGIELTGTEVRSLRERPCQITDCYCIVRQEQLWLVGVHIHPFSHGTVWNVDPDRRRRLLMHKRQIRYLDEKLRIKGMSVVPLMMYFDEHNRVKLQVGLARGKKLYDKRHDLAKKQADRDIQRALKDRLR
jgi:SsrA-binding protein